MNSGSISTIIKDGNINIEGVCQLPIGPGSAVYSAVGATENNSSHTNGQVSARVIQTTAGYATIEVVCPCGAVSQIRCNYNAGS